MVYSDMPFAGIRRIDLSLCIAESGRDRSEGQDLRKTEGNGGTAVRHGAHEGGGSREPGGFQGLCPLYGGNRGLSGIPGLRSRILSVWGR